MFLKHPKTRDFEYRPRFYTPISEDDEEENRIKFRKLRHSKPVPKRSLMGMVIIIVVLMFLIRYFFKISSEEHNAPIEQLKIEIVE
ncbi:hypothetical protein H8E88_31035 [candidate division KSB1 bacterium]|nr:hypothetical protein [candidate division KSB1 bacterium]MBL7094191.1 hypothetical protein [candidate division KSB1 bacterium]